MNLSFPNYKCWINSIILLIYNSIAFFIIRIINRFFTYYGISIHKSIDYINILLLLFYLLIYWMILSWMDYIFFGTADPNPKHLKYFPSNKSMLKGFYNSLISIISIIICLIIFSPFLDIISNKYYILTISWIIISSFLLMIKESKLTK